MGNAPKDDLYLICGHYLVAVKTTLKQRIGNTLESSSDTGDQVSYSLTGIYKGKSADLLEPTSIGSAYLQAIRLGSNSERDSPILNKVNKIIFLFWQKLLSFLYNSEKKN
tara:strand:+ start:802 stop:1131 length:330 start_codon:yes stop_codon:yes gene_type:complete